MEQILLAFGVPIGTVAAIMLVYRNTKVKDHSPDGDTDYFDIVAGVLQGHTLSPYVFIICLDYVLRTSRDKMKDNGFMLKKERSRRYLVQTITDAKYRDDIVLLPNTPARAETQLHSLERAAAGIGLHVNAHKMEYMCFNQRGDIFTQNGSSLKLVDKFIYLGSSVSSTGTDVNIWLAKAWTAIDRLSVIWKSDLTDKIKRSFFLTAVVSILLLNVWRKSLTATTQECCEQYWTSYGGNTPQSSSYTATYNPSWKVRRTKHSGHCWRSRDKLISDILL